MFLLPPSKPYLLPFKEVSLRILRLCDLHVVLTDESIVAQLSFPEQREAVVKSLDDQALTCILDCLLKY